MQSYLKAKAIYGRGFSRSYHMPDFKHVTGHKQIELKIKKRQEDTERHGVKTLKEKMEKGELQILRDTEHQYPDIQTNYWDYREYWK